MAANTRRLAYYATRRGMLAVFGRRRVAASPAGTALLSLALGDPAKVRTGTAVSFNGTTQRYAGTGWASGPQRSWVVPFRPAATPASGSQHVIAMRSVGGGGVPLRLTVASTGLMNVIIADNAGSVTKQASGGEFVPAAWNLGVGVVDSDAVAASLNGGPLVYSATSGTFGAFGSDFRLAIGALPNSDGTTYSSYFSGEIGPALISDSLLTDAEIAAVWNGGAIDLDALPPGFTSALSFGTHFDGQDPTAWDISGNERHLTSAGSPTVSVYASPVDRAAYHKRRISRWIGTGDRAFTPTAGAGSPEYRGERQRLRYTAPDQALASVGDPVLGGRSAWHYHASPSLDLRRLGGLHDELGSDGSRLSIGVDHVGHVEVVARKADGTVSVARSTGSLARRYAAAIAETVAVTPYASDNVHRLAHDLYLGPGQDLAVGEYVTARGFGYPTDGEHPIVRSSADAVRVVVDQPVPISGAVRFHGFYEQALSRAADAVSAGGDITLLWSGWVNFWDDFGEQTIAGVWLPTGNQRSWRAYKTSGHVLAADFSADGTNVTTVSSGVTATEEVWRLVAIYHDHVNDLVGIKINNGSWVTAAHTGGLFNSATARLAFGSHGTTGAWTASLRASVDSPMLFKSPTSSFDDIATALYNAGSGIDPNDLTPTQVTDFGLAAGWPFDEEDGGDDVMGGAALTAAGNTGILPILAAGKVIRSVPDPAPETAGARKLEQLAIRGQSRNVLGSRLPSPVSGRNATFGGWVRLRASSTTGAGLVASWAPGDLRGLSSFVGIDLDGSGNWRAYLPGGGSAVIGSAGGVGGEHHIAVAIDGDTLRTYYDGTASATLDLSSDPDLASRWEAIGFGYSADGTLSANADISRWQFFLGDTLTPEQIATIANGGDGTEWADLDPGVQALATAGYDCHERGNRLLDASGGDLHLDCGGLIGTAVGPDGGVPWAETTEDGEVIGTGRHVCGALLTSTDAHAVAQNTPSDLDPLEIDVSRSSDGTVAFYLNGASIGTDTLPADNLGPTGDDVTVSVFGAAGASPSPAGTLVSVGTRDAPLGASGVFGRAAAASFRLTKVRGCPKLPVIAVVQEPPGVLRRQRDGAEYLHAIINRATGLPHDLRVAQETGQCYSFPEGFVAGQVLAEPGTYDWYGAILSPPYDDDGDPADRSLVWAGLAGTVVVDDWPADAQVVHVDPDAVGASDNNSGSEAAPLATIGEALSRIVRPNGRIRVKRGSSFLLPASPTLSTTALNVGNRPGPILVDAYGDSGDPLPTIAPADSTSYTSLFDVSKTFDFRIAEIEATGIGVGRFPHSSGSSPKYATFVFASSLNDGALLYKCVNDNCWYTYTTSNNGSKHLVVDGCTIDAGTNGTFLVSYMTPPDHMVWNFNEVNGEPGEHFLRIMDGQFFAVFGLGRTSGAWVFGPYNCITPRGHTFYGVVSHCYGHDVTSRTSFESVADPYRMGALFYQILHSRTTSIYPGENWTIRNCWIHPSAIGVNTTTQPLIPDPVNIKVYGNQIESPASFTWGSVTPLVDELNFTRGTGTLAAPPIVLADSGAGVAVLAGAYPTGAAPLRYTGRWGSRAAGSGDAFAAIPGGRGFSAIDAVPDGGSREYRFDLTDTGENEALGATPETVVVAAADDTGIVP